MDSEQQRFLYQKTKKGEVELYQLFGTRRSDDPFATIPRLLVVDAADAVPSSYYPDMPANAPREAKAAYIALKNAYPRKIASGVVVLFNDAMECIAQLNLMKGR